MSTLEPMPVAQAVEPKVIEALRDAMKSVNAPIITEKGERAASWDAVSFIQSHGEEVLEALTSSRTNATQPALFRSRSKGSDYWHTWQTINELVYRDSGGNRVQGMAPWLEYQFAYTASPPPPLPEGVSEEDVSFAVSLRRTGAPMREILESYLERLKNKNAR